MTDARAALAIVRVGPGEVERVVPLFDAYRRFSGEPADLAASHSFLGERVARGESVIFLAAGTATSPEENLGFVQLYPAFASSVLARIFVLNDLFVWPDARGHGVGRALLARARDHARSAGARRLDLRAARANTGAQALYESLGYERNDAFYQYSLRV